VGDGHQVAAHGRRERPQLRSRRDDRQQEKR
jgi:hypothetical protein